MVTFEYEVVPTVSVGHEHETQKQLNELGVKGFRVVGVAPCFEISWIILSRESPQPAVG
jgi:hypothetical protein